MIAIYNKSMKLFSGSANKELAKEISSYLGINLSKLKISHFKDGETYVKIEDNVRGCDTFVIQPTCAPVNENIMELAIIADCLRRASADRVTAVIPYYGYARQDRKAKPREPITSKLVANLLVSSGVDRVLTIDLHSGQIQGFFDIPLDHLMAVTLLGNVIKKKGLKNTVVVSPDAGGVKKARVLATVLDAPLAIVDKRRSAHNVAEVMNVIGEVKGKTCILIDDMIDTAGTISEAAKTLSKKGAKEVFVCATHAILSDPAVERLDVKEIKEVLVTNTVPLPKKKRLKKIVQISVGPLLGEAIKRIHDEDSVSALFDQVLSGTYNKKLTKF